MIQELVTALLFIGGLITLYSIGVYLPYRLSK